MASWQTAAPWRKPAQRTPEDEHQARRPPPPTQAPRSQGHQQQFSAFGTGPLPPSKKAPAPLKPGGVAPSSVPPRAPLASAKQPEARFCHNCGHALIPEARFCNKCGTKCPPLEPEETHPEPEPEQQRAATHYRERKATLPKGADAWEHAEEPKGMVYLGRKFLGAPKPVTPDWQSLRTCLIKMFYHRTKWNGDTAYRLERSQRGWVREVLGDVTDPWDAEHADHECPHPVTLQPQERALSRIHSLIQESFPKFAREGTQDIPDDFKERVLTMLEHSQRNGLSAAGLAVASNSAMQRKRMREWEDADANDEAQVNERLEEKKRKRNPRQLRGRGEWSIVKEKMIKFASHRRRWMEDPEYRLTKSRKGFIYETTSRVLEVGWDAYNADDECPHPVAYDETRQLYLRMYEVYEARRGPLSEDTPEDLKEALLDMMRSLPDGGQNALKGAYKTRAEKAAERDANEGDADAGEEGDEEGEGYGEGYEVHGGDGEWGEGHEEQDAEELAYVGPWVRKRQL